MMLLLESRPVNGETATDADRLAALRRTARVVSVSAGESVSLSLTLPE